MPVTSHSGYYNPTLDYGSSAVPSVPGLNNSVAPSTGYPGGSALGSATEASGFNLGNSGNVQSISDLVNSINQAAQKSAQAARIPNNPALEAQSSTNIGSELAGQVPQDVMQILQQQAAERGVSSGVGADSPNANSAYLKALGLTSLQQQQTGQSNLSAADARNPAAPIFDPTSQIITPYQGAQLGLQQQQISNNQLNSQTQAALQAKQNALRYGQSSGYSSPNLNYGTQAPTITGNSLFAPDTGYTDTGTTGTGTTSSTTLSQPGAFQNNFYDYNPTLPPELGSGLPGYDTTPQSMYG